MEEREARQLADDLQKLEPHRIVEAELRDGDWIVVIRSSDTTDEQPMGRDADAIRRAMKPHTDPLPPAH